MPLMNVYMRNSHGWDSCPQAVYEKERQYIIDAYEILVSYVSGKRD